MEIARYVAPRGGEFRLVMDPDHPQSPWRLEGGNGRCDLPVEQLSTCTGCRGLGWLRIAFVAARCARGAAPAGATIWGADGQAHADLRFGHGEARGATLRIRLSDPPVERMRRTIPPHGTWPCQPNVACLPLP